MAKIVVISGGFDPLHSGHCAYFKAARELGDKLIVGVNSDKWLERKKKYHFMPFHERFAVVSAMKYVDEVREFNDNDGSAKDLILDVLADHREHDDVIIFANGGDRTKENIPEMELLDHTDRLIFEFGVGGSDKKNSSSKMITEYKEKMK